MDLKAIAKGIVAGVVGVTIWQYIRADSGRVVAACDLDMSGSCDGQDLELLKAHRGHCRKGGAWTLSDDRGDYDHDGCITDGDVEHWQMLVKQSKP